MDTPIRFFRKECPPGYVYACSLHEIEEVLAAVPADDIHGLTAAGLLPLTKKDSRVYGRYFPGRRSVALYSTPGDLEFRLDKWLSVGRIRQEMAPELQFGLQIAEDGGRYTCRWELESLRLFLLHHVLLHELGHHVNEYVLRRPGSGKAAEAFAEHYASRIRKAHLGYTW